jgi:diguanylate cyclase (GGDEF)-like protein/PAS domain S-box-containing protein
MDRVPIESLYPVLDDIGDQAVLITVPDMVIVHANRDYLSAVGMTLEHARGRHCYAVSHHSDRPCDLDGHDCPVRDAMKTGKVSHAVHLHYEKGGAQKLVEVAARPIRNETGEIAYVVEIIKGSDEQRRLHEDLKRKTGFLEKILQTCPEGIIGNDPKGNLFLFNVGAEKIFGYSRAEVIGKVRARDLYPPGLAREVKNWIYSEEYGGRGRLVDYETEVVNKDGKKIPIRLCCTVIHEDGEEVGTIGFFTDITERKALQERFLESEEKFRGIFETAHDAMVSLGEDGRILLANRSAEELTEYDGGEITGMHFGDLFPAKYRAYCDEILAYVSSRVPGRPGNIMELSILRKRGSEVSVQMSLADKGGKGKKILTAIIRDISERKAMEEELRLLSITDSLTRLYNRRHFHSLAVKEIERARRSKGRFALLLIDVDNFKKYNDTYGHSEGDVVLRSLGELIMKSFRAMDSGFRFGGEEFTVLLPDTTAEQAMISAERLRMRFSEMEFLPVPGGDPVRVTISIGISEYIEGFTLDDLTRFADLAMYAAKNGGRNRTLSYESAAGPKR